MHIVLIRREISHNKVQAFQYISHCNTGGLTQSIEQNLPGMRDTMLVKQ